MKSRRPPHLNGGSYLEVPTNRNADVRRPSAEEVVWSIGDLSLDPAQFSEHLFTPAAQATTFVVGDSDPRVSWPRLHPGPLDAASGFRSFSISVQFELDAAWSQAAAAGELALAIDLYASHGPCPQLLVEVDGLVGRYVLEPHRGSRADALRRQSPVSGTVHLIASLPAGALVVGANELVIRTISDEAPTAEERAVARTVWGTLLASAVTWRRLALVRTDPAGPEARLIPTPLYVTEGSALRELATLRIRTARAVKKVEAVISVGDEVIRTSSTGVRIDFGDIVAGRLSIPALEAPVASSIDARLDDELIHVDSVFEPARRWTVHLMPNVHLDLGYSDRQGKVFEVHNRNLDRALDLIETTDTFRFTVDGSITVENYLAARSSQRVSQVLSRLSDGHLELNGYAMLFLSGVAGLEELYRAAYTSIGLACAHSLPVRHAHLTDVPSYSWSIPSTLRSLGIDSFIGMPNHTRGGNQDSDELHLLSPVRWAGPDGAEVLAFFADSYCQLRFICGDTPTIAGMIDGLSRFVGLYDRDDYLPNDLPMIGTHMDNEDLGDGFALAVDRWNQRFRYPQMRFSTFTEYLDAVRPFLDQLPRISGDGGSYWEDGAGTYAELAAKLRAARARMSAADALSALAATHDGSLAPNRAILDRGWQQLVVGAEHTMTAAQATSRPESPAIAEQLSWTVHQVESAWHIGVDEGDRALSQLAELLALRHPQVLVVNLTAWDRTVEVIRDLPVTSRVFDESGNDLPVELLSAPTDGYAPLAIRVPDVPAFGFRVLTVAPGVDRAMPQLADDLSFSALGYDVTISRDGRITGLLHRSAGRELLDPDSAYSLAEVLYVSGGGDATDRGQYPTSSLFDYDPALPPPSTTVHRATMRLVGHAAVPGGYLVKLSGSAPSLPKINVELRIRDDDTIEAGVRLEKESVLAKESVYIAFPFLVSNPTVRYDRQISWVDPSRDHLPGAANEWFAVQHGVAVTGSEGGMLLATVDSPLVTLDIVQGTWATTCEPRSGTVLSWVMNNYWWTNTPPSQHGTVEFRYAFRPIDAWDEAAATRFVREAAMPALVNEVTLSDRSIPGEARPTLASRRLIDVDLPQNIDMTIHAGRKHGAMTLRLQEIGGMMGGTGRVRHPSGPLGSAFLCDAAERHVGGLLIGTDGWVDVPVGRYAVVTISLTGPDADHTGDDA